MSKVGQLLLSAHVCVFVFWASFNLKAAAWLSPRLFISISFSLPLSPPIANTVSYGVVEGKTPSLSFILSRYFSFPGIVVFYIVVFLTMTSSKRIEKPVMNKH